MDENQGDDVERQGHGVNELGQQVGHPPPIPWKAYTQQGAAEALATFGVVFVSCAAAAIGRNDPHLLPRIVVSLISGFAVAAESYTFGHISQTHVNPFITIWFAYFLNFEWKRVPFYLAGQICGVATASLMLRFILYHLEDFGTTSPIRPPLQAFFVEAIFSMLVILTKTAISSDPRAMKEFGGIAVGFTIAIGSFLAGPISGGSMNPYRSLGSAIATNKYDHMLMYVGAHFFGSLAATFGYAYIFEPLSYREGIGVLGGILLSHDCGFGHSRLINKTRSYTK